MSRNIPTDKPLSDEDRAWLEDWSQHDLIRAIDAAFPPSDKADDDDDDDDDAVDVDPDIAKYAESLKVAELKAALDKFEIKSDGHKKDELEADLAIGLQEKRNAGETFELPEVE